MPQNSWAWNGPTSGMWEWWWRGRLRIASDMTMARAIGTVRLCSNIPCRGTPLGDPLPNVLDLDFEEALNQSSFAPGFSDAFVCHGSGISYKNLGRAIEGYALYRQRGGLRPLHLFVSPPRQQALAGVAPPPGLQRHTGHWKRPEVASVLRSSFAVLFPSLVEASPISVLEAIALECRIVLSDISGHRETTQGRVPDECYFDPSSPDELASAMLRCESLSPVVGDSMASPSARADQRETWAEDLCGRLGSLL